MRKIPTLFVRDPGNVSRVLPEVHPACGWVLDGEGAATRKYNGTCVMHDGAAWWARREVRPGRKAPAGYVPLSTDPATGKVVGWEPIEQSAFAKFHAEALSNGDYPWEPGTYELIGPKINGNPERAPIHQLVEHASAQILDAPRNFKSLALYLRDLPYEGIVWHHPDGRMAKLKKRDLW